MSSSMTAQHFNAIAGAIATIDGINLRRAVAEKLAPIMASFNDNFNRAGFMTACGCDKGTPVRPIRRQNSISGSTSPELALTPEQIHNIMSGPMYESGYVGPPLNEVRTPEGDGGNIGLSEEVIRRMLRSENGR